MEHAVHAAHGPAHRGAVEQVGDDDLAVESGEVVAARRTPHGQAQIVAALGEQPRDVRAHESRRSGHQGRHGR
ncbi:MAG: hypothetical protein U0S48_04055 [Solirubrobacteraceae bacterium]